MKIKKIFSLAVTLMLALCVSLTAFASEYDSAELTIDTVPGTETIEPVWHEDTLLSATLTSFSFSGLGQGNTKRSSESYYVNPGETVLNISTLSWTPTGQDVRVGFVSASDPSVKYGVTYSGGSISGKNIATKNVPAGEYYIFVKNVGSDSRSVTGSVQYSVS